MQLSEFDYLLPKHLIAQRPKEPRDSSRMMVLQKDRIEHKTFRDFVEYLKEGDILVLNDSRVLHARLLGKKGTGGKVDLLLVERIEGNTWACLISGKNIRTETELIFGEGELKGKVKQKADDGKYEVEFEHVGTFEEIIQKIGIMPTPPYIKKILKDPKIYQTIYAKEDGSIAAPTAGLHFTDPFLDTLRSKGIEIVTVTLHISIGTFLPVKSEDVLEHKMDPECFKIKPTVARKINQSKRNGKRIFAVGTTAVKTLESACNEKGEITKLEGKSDLFIYPGYEFKFGLNGLLTNFHLPKSTLIMLVSAYAGRDTILNAYKIAIDNSYRFYSFGDSMLLLM
jgi:S-adenosylmethionine:tRNA ribosyltransferase-isomerase